MRCSWICKLNITKFWNKSETKHVYNTRGKYSTLNKAMLCEVLPTYVIRVLSSASPIDFLNSDDEKLATGQVCRILRRNEPQLTKQLKLLNQVLKAMFWYVSLPHNITTGTTQFWGTTHVTMIQSALVHPILNGGYQFLNQLKHEQPCK